MKWKINRDGIVQDQTQKLVCILPENYDEHYAALIKYAPEMYDAIRAFCESQEQTIAPRNPVKHYKAFQSLLENIVENS